MSKWSTRTALAAVATMTLGFAGSVTAGESPNPNVTYRGLHPVVKFDVSPPLRDIPPKPIPDLSLLGRLMVDPGEIPTGDPYLQDVDPLVQGWTEAPLVPSPIVSFDGVTNIAGFSPPDPVGDVGPNHYVVMSNVYFAVLSKTGTTLYGPAANNTLWTGFGGDCETDNAGDPIVLHDQIADRWLLSQFTSSGSTYFNCIAISQTANPTGSWYRYAVSTGSNFPDYPKYGVWPDAYYISTREVIGGGGDTIGAYAVNRAQMIAGNPNPQVISFLVTGSGSPYLVGNGLLPSDLDGPIPPPAGTPNYFLGSQDNGGGYGAPSDALNVWQFHVDWATPANSTFTLTHTLPIAAYDTIPAFCSGRSCVPQPGTSNRVDHLGYRQRPLHRAAYRNLGTHQSLVTNQSVEASTTMSGIRWWELRFPGGTPTLHQEGTYAPGVTDGIHRWMGSIAMDGAGNMALGYSASAGTGTFPSSWYTGRLAGSPLGVMDQGEGSFIDGTGSQTGSQRWGDYTSMNVDPLDDCTFWYVNQYNPTTSSVGWVLRVGAFKFDACGTPDFYLGVDPASAAACLGGTVNYTVNVGSISGFTDPVTLGLSGQPAGAPVAFTPNPVTPAGTSALAIGPIASGAAGTYPLTISGTSTTGTKNLAASLDLFTAAPGAAGLTAPANGAINQPIRPTFQWSAATQAETYRIQIATDPGFSAIVLDDQFGSATTYTPAIDLGSNTQYFWRVTAYNPCGVGVASSTFTFTTLPLPGDCPIGDTAVQSFSEGFEVGPPPGWTISGTGNTWSQSAARFHGGAFSLLAVDQATATEAVLVSPQVLLPSGHALVTLQYWTDQTMEDRTGGCYDGGVLEISANGGTTWSHVPTTRMLTDPYEGPIQGTSNVLNGLPGWCGDPQPWLESVVDLAGYEGQYVRFRFRLASDSSVGRVPHGWYLDDLVVQSCVSPSHLFAHGFESGDLVPWSGQQP